jgi:hypothetical protein
MAIDQPKGRLNLSDLMFQHCISLLYHVEEVEKGQYRYCYISIAAKGPFGSEGSDHASCGDTPEIAVHNLLEYKALLRSNAEWPDLELLKAHKQREQEAIRILTTKP